MEVPPGEIRIGVLFHLDGTEKTIYDYYIIFLFFFKRMTWKMNHVTQ